MNPESGCEPKPLNGAPRAGCPTARRKASAGLSFSKNQRKIEIEIRRSLRKGRSFFSSAAALFFLFFVVPISSAEDGIASWYSTEACKYNPDKRCPTASGKSLYDLEEQQVLFAASWAYPFGTKVRVANRENSKSVVVEIVDRGPAKRLNRVIDLGKEAYRRIAPLKSGVIHVSVERMELL